jgi:ABC-2 type transport system permease protein
MGDLDWGLVAGRVGLLLALVVVSATFATRAFRTYQRSL